MDGIMTEGLKQDAAFKYSTFLGILLETFLRTCAVFFCQAGPVSPAAEYAVKYPIKHVDIENHAEYLL